MDRQVRVVHYLNQFFGGTWLLEPTELLDGAVWGNLQRKLHLAHPRDHRAEP